MAFKNLEPPDCQQLMQDAGYRYIDVRTPEEFSAGHPTGSLNVPYALIGPGGMMVNPQFLAVMQRLVTESDAPLIVGCAAGGRSVKACMMLAAAGYTDLVNVRTGFGGQRNDVGVLVDPGWADAGLPVSAGDDDGSYDALRRSLTPPTE